MFEQLEEITWKLGNSPRGYECIFIKLTDEIGAKIFQDENKCRAAYQQQKLAAENGLAPNVYGISSAPNKTSPLWFYMTEVVETMPTIIQENGQVLAIERFSDIQREEFSRLCRDLEEIGIHSDTICDLYESNVGFKGGKMVAIDFGRS